MGALTDPRQEAKVTSVALHVGERHELRLHNLETAGYAWTYTIGGDAEAVEIQELPIEMPPRTTEHPMTASPDITLAITGKQPGQVHIRFALRRPWEKSTTGYDPHILDVSVLE